MTAPFLLMLLFAQQSGAAAPASPAQVLADLQQAIRKNPEVEANYTELGNLLLRSHNFNEAALVLGAARKRFPSSAQAALSLGVAYYGLRRFPEAVDAFLEAGRLDADAEQPVRFLNRMPENWGDSRARVIELFSAFARKHPKSALAHFALGSATRNAAELRTAIRLNPRMPEGHMELGTILEAERDYNGAILCFRRAAALAPKNPVPHYRLSRLYARTGDSVRAEQERALHEKLSAEEKAELDRRQAATQHLDLSLRP
jgi:cytochrome c-type biogenesis protein CcmH/NrfG